MNMLFATNYDLIGQMERLGFIDKETSDDLKQKIEKSFDLQELEDLYLPYKKRKKTKADAAREKGLEPLAKIMMSQNSRNIEEAASRFLGKDVQDEEILEIISKLT